MLKAVALRSCARCGGPVRRSADDAERLRCLECGWRSYADKMSARGAGEFRIWLPYIGDRKDAARLNLLAADVLGRERWGQIVAADSLPALFRTAKSHGVRHVTRQYWHCPDGHSVRLEFSRWEYTGCAARPESRTGGLPPDARAAQGFTKAAELSV